MIDIDGSKYEGGGSIVRNSIALSLITQKPFRITNIRKNRSKPGLKKQHLAGVKLAKLISDSKSTNTYLGSETLEFYPGKIKKGKKISIDIESAGSITLLLQNIFLPCLLSGEKFDLTIKGGTDVPHSPPMDYFKHVFLPHFKDICEYKLDVISRGYYPKGGGEINFKFKKKHEKTINISYSSKLIFTKIFLHASKDFEKEKMLESLIETFQVYLQDFNLRFYPGYTETKSTDYGFCIVPEYETGSKSGYGQVAGKIITDDLVKKACKKFIKEYSYGDEYLPDQMVNAIAFLGGEIEVPKETLHLKSNIYVLEKFLGNKKIKYKNKKLSHAKQCD